MPDTKTLKIWWHLMIALSYRDHKWVNLTKHKSFNQELKTKSSKRRPISVKLYFYKIDKKNIKKEFYWKNLMKTTKKKMKINQKSTLNCLQNTKKLNFLNLKKTINWYKMQIKLKNLNHSIQWYQKYERNISQISILKRFQIQMLVKSVNQSSMRVTKMWSMRLMTQKL